MPFTFQCGPLAGLIIIQPRVFHDARGFFFESYREEDFRAAGICESLIQDNHSCSGLGVVRGLHYQRDPYAQGKLIWVTRGRVWDVSVDLRCGSLSFGKWFGLELSTDNRTMLWIPAGFAHGYLSLEDGTELQYKCSAEYHPEVEDGIRWDDPTIGIAWPDLGSEPLLSAKDLALPLFDPRSRYFS